MPAIIVDMDGTLCDVSAVRHYVNGDRKNFRAFHEASLFCPPRDDVHALVTTVPQWWDVIIVTARDARFERVTRDWLAKHGVRYAALFMRPWGDQRRDSDVKAEIFDQIVARGFEPILAIDDRRDIADVWRARGVETWVVDSEDAPG